MDDPYIPNSESLWNHGSLKTTDGIRSALSKGGDANEREPWRGMTPLHHAAKYGDEEAIALLMENGAEINSLCGNDQTPLHSALMSRITIPTVIDTLIGHGAEVNDGQSMTVAMDYAPQMMETLINAGADVNRKGPNDETALHRAALTDYAYAVLVLMANGADINARAYDGARAFDVTRNGSECEALLKSAHQKQDLLEGLATQWKPSDCKEEPASNQDEQLVQVKRRKM